MITEPHTMFPTNRRIITSEHLATLIRSTKYAHKDATAAADVEAVVKVEQEAGIETASMKELLALMMRPLVSNSAGSQVQPRGSHVGADHASSQKNAALLVAQAGALGAAQEKTAAEAEARTKILANARALVASAAAEEAKNAAHLRAQASAEGQTEKETAAKQAAATAPLGANAGGGVKRNADEAEIMLQDERQAAEEAWHKATEDAKTRQAAELVAKKPLEEAFAVLQAQSAEAAVAKKVAAEVAKAEFAKKEAEEAYAFLKAQEA